MAANEVQQALDVLYGRLGDVLEQLAWVGPMREHLTHEQQAVLTRYALFCKKKEEGRASM